MRIYADTSVLVAWFHPVDEFAQRVTEWCRRQSAEFSWNPFLRVEVRHNLRRLAGAYGEIAWHAYRSSETLGRLQMGRERLMDLLEWGDELSARLAANTTAGTWDYIHVAAVQRNRDQCSQLAMLHKPDWRDLPNFLECISSSNVPNQS